MTFFLTLFEAPPLGDLAESLAAWLALLLPLLSHAVAAASLLRLGAVWLEGFLVIWIAQTPDSRFWLFWARLMQSLDYISASIPRRPHAIRALYKWDEKRKEDRQQRERRARAALGTPDDKHSPSK